MRLLTSSPTEEAFKRANHIPYGLSAGVWTDKGSKIFKMVNKLCAGEVWANTYNKFDPTSPFGDTKRVASVARADCTDWRGIVGWIEQH